MTTIPKEVEELKERVLHLERILILGDGDRVPLAETVRNLTKTVSDYISQKDKEEQKKKDDWNKVKWIVISFAIPAAIVFIGQAFIFFFRIYPILEKLSN